MTGIKKPTEVGLNLWWRGRDSNPGRATNPRWFSRPVLSTTQPPLRACVDI